MLERQRKKKKEEKKEKDKTEKEQKFGWGEIIPSRKVAARKLVSFS